MTILITGGTSSIGRVLVKELARRGETLRVLVRPNSDRTGLDLPGVEFLPGDVTDPVSVREAVQGCQFVCHLAAVVGSQVPEAVWWRVNRDGTQIVLQAALDAGVRAMVQVSSLSVLGNTEPGETADESHLPDPSMYRNLYQKTKRAADDLAREYACLGLRVAIVYPGFGYGHSWASSHPSLQDQTLLRMAAGKPAAVFGSGKNRLCLSYYKDTVAGICLALEKGRPGEDYLLGGENLTFPEIWTGVAGVLGKRPPQRRIPIGVLKLLSSTGKLLTGRGIFPNDFFDMVGLNWCYSSAKATHELGWQATPFREGIADTWQSYQAAGWKTS